MSEFHEKLWQVAVTLTAVAAWIGCLVWLVRSTKPQADDDTDIPDAERCIWCGDLADGRYGRRNPLSMCADHGLRQLELDDSERIEDF